MPAPGGRKLDRGSMGLNPPPPSTDTQTDTCLQEKGGNRIISRQHVDATQLQ